MSSSDSTGRPFQNVPDGLDGDIAPDQPALGSPRNSEAAARGSTSDFDDTARRRLRSLFRFIRELHLVRNPVVTEVRSHPWVLSWRDIPEHDAVRKLEADEDESLLRVRRADKKLPPPPPEALRTWLLPGWDDPLKEAAIRAKDVSEDSATGEPITTFFQDDDARRVAWEGWSARRKAWSEAERPARRALDLFGRLYDLHGRIEREGEQYELLLGDGIVRSGSVGQVVDHPVLTVRVELVFDPTIPEFSVRETDRGPDLVGSVLRSVSDAQLGGIELLRHELESGQFHPLGGKETSGFLRTVIHRVLPTDGEYCDDREAARSKPGPVLFRDPVVFLRKKVPGIAEMADRILEDLEKRDRIPPGLERIVGVDRAMSERSQGVQGVAIAAAPVDVLLSKPANAEQFRIVEQLDRSGCVLVQGPPGTGKSHTIGNLIGHLLAQGKSVLVTAHTIKSLRVLRGYVEREIQSLCMSVLDADLESRSALEESVSEIVRRLGEDADGSANGREAERLGRKRAELKAELQAAEKDLEHARADEHRKVVVGGGEVDPAEAARRIRTEAGTWGWLPAGLRPGVALPISATEVDELYQSNVRLTEGDEAELDGVLPPLSALVPPDQVACHIRNLRELQAADRSSGRAYWTSTPVDDSDCLRGLAVRLKETASQIDHMPAWLRAIAAVGADGERAQGVWRSLLRQIDEFLNVAETTAELRYSHVPKLAPGFPLREQQETASQIVAHLAGGGRLGLVVKVTRPPWRRLMQAARVRTGSPVESAHFSAIGAEAQHTLLSDALRSRWNRQVQSLGGPNAEAMSAFAERTMREYGDQVRKALDWYEVNWRPLEQRLNESGFRVSEAVGSLPPIGGCDGNILRLAQAIESVILPAVEARIIELALGRANRVLTDLEKGLGQWTAGALGQKLLRALVTRDLAGYAQAYERREELEWKAGVLESRRRLLARLEGAAKGWASAVRLRRAPHDAGCPPGPVESAWMLRQWSEELDRRAAKNLDQLQAAVHRLRDEVLRVTAELVEKRAWAFQIAKTSLVMKQALVGWQQLVRRIGKGTGKRAPRLRREAQKLMEQAVGTVPVWIMPLAQVAEQFDPRERHFDVVIIDEASQSDVLALTALYLGHDTVVVGDDEQVSPEAVGQDLDVVDALISEHLHDVPNRANFDGKLSVYDLAKASFGAALTLREHFRCVPEIIQFCNQLSYPGSKSLIPLRDASGVSRRPFVVPYRVESGGSRGKVNEVEALTVASLLIAALAEPEYQKNERDKPVTFGVISLVGEEQAYRIDSILRQRISPREYETRRILCGTPAQFQGDERDVVFLTMVDAPSGNGPLPLRHDDRFKKRYNVAVSRARDQLWVVYSLNPDTDLKGDDLRLRLLRYAQDPGQATRELLRVESRAQSEFERLVLRDLSGRGYRVTAQFSVGRYSIDMVVECDGRRMAVECDGDRFHGLEQLDADMQRQALLERLGWRFVRIRGSSFFRNPDGVMSGVVERLQSAGIFPVAGPSAEPVASDVRARIVANAEEIRSAWGETEEGTDDGDLDVSLQPPLATAAVPGGAAPVGPGSSAPGQDGSPVAGGTPPGSRRVADVERSGGAGWVSDYDAVVVLLRARGAIASRDVQSLLGVDRVDAAVHLRRLVRDGLAVMEGSKRGSRYRLIVDAREGVSPSSKGPSLPDAP